MKEIKSVNNADLQTAVNLFSELSDEAKDEIINLLKCLLHIDN